MRLHRGLSLLAVPLLGVPLLSGCDSAGPRLSPDTVARAADYSLQVEQAAELLAPINELPNDPEVVSALADFWVDYHLLALAVNREGELDRMDLSSIYRQQEHQELVVRLRDQVIDDDEEVTEEELEEFYRTERPGERVRARHVLLLIPDDATPAQVDSLEALATEIRDQARAGADFAALAEEWSEDPGSAARGGDLDYFSRGAMVPPFEEAAFSLEPGEISDVVRTQFGFHVIRVEDREFPELEEVRDQLRNQFQAQRTARAESIFVAGIEEPANITVTEDGVELAKELASDPEATLSSRAANRPLTRYEGGTYSAREFREFILNQPEQLRQQIETAPEEQVDNLLRNLTRGELLVEEARRRGIALTPEEAETFRSEIRSQYRNVADLLQLSGVEPEEGQSLEAAIAARVDQVMYRIVRGEQDVFPLGALTLPLRDHFGARVNESALERVVDRVESMRAEDAPSPAPDPGADPPPLMEEVPQEDGETGGGDGGNGTL